MKDGDLMLKDAKKCLLQRLDSHSLGNDNTAIERNEIEDSCNECGKLRVSFDGVFSAFCAKRGERTAATRHEFAKDLDCTRPCWHQLSISVAPKSHAAMSHLPYLL